MVAGRTDDASRAGLMAELRAQGISDARVLQAMADTPREMFVETPFAPEAYADRALPIACGQTISQPFIVAYMTEALAIGPRLRVLEIGTGSGYQTAVLSRLCRMVYTVERHKPLLSEAEARFKKLGLSNIVIRHGDGYQGWPETAPFDRILVTAAFPELPVNLTQQLKPGGILISPVGYESISQHLSKIIRSEEGASPPFRTETLLPVLFVPMVPGLPQEGRESNGRSGMGSSPRKR
jgi:protein-L-isoaspartate(D-aspartate) O-methyltransferase